MSDSSYKCGYSRTFTNEWAVYQIINNGNPKKTSVHDSLQTANSEARSIWDQFNQDSISDEMVTCDEPNLPYEVFKCVNYNACSLYVYVSELPLKSFNVKQLKQFGHNNLICLDGCKRKEELYNRVKPVVDHKIHINNLIEFDPDNCAQCALKKMCTSYEESLKSKVEETENKEMENKNKSSNEKRKELDLDNQELKDDDVVRKKRKLNSNRTEELIEMGIPETLHRYKWLYENCNMLNDESRDKIVKYLMGKYTKTEETEDVLLNSETNVDGTVTKETIFRMLFPQKKWKKICRKRIKK